MNVACSHCQRKIGSHPSLFTFAAIHCQHCGTELRTNIRSRLLFVVSFGVLIAYHLYLKVNGSESNQVIVWGGLAAIMVPLVLTLTVNRYERGAQKSVYSMLVNGAFCLMVVLLIYSWAAT